MKPIKFTIISDHLTFTPSELEKVQHSDIIRFSAKKDLEIFPFNSQQLSMIYGDKGKLFELLYELSAIYDIELS